MQELDASLLVMEDGDLGRLIAGELAAVGPPVDLALSVAAARECMRRRAYTAVLVDLRLCDVRRGYRPAPSTAGPTLQVIAPASLEHGVTDARKTTDPGLIAAFEALLAPASDDGARAVASFELLRGADPLVVGLGERRTHQPEDARATRKGPHDIECAGGSAC
jgi:hypothetical protein